MALSSDATTDMRRLGHKCSWRFIAGAPLTICADLGWILASGSEQLCHGRSAQFKARVKLVAQGRYATADLRRLLQEFSGWLRAGISPLICAYQGRNLASGSGQVCHG